MTNLELTLIGGYAPVAMGLYVVNQEAGCPDSGAPAGSKPRRGPPGSDRASPDRALAARTHPRAPPR